MDRGSEARRRKGSLLGEIKAELTFGLSATTAFSRRALSFARESSNMYSKKPKEIRKVNVSTSPWKSLRDINLFRKKPEPLRVPEKPQE